MCTVLTVGVLRRKGRRSSQSGTCAGWDIPRAGLPAYRNGTRCRGVEDNMGKTLIVDDEADMRLLLRITIDAENRGLKVIGEASSGEEAITLCPDLSPDVVVLDHRMPGLTGLDTARLLLSDEPDLPIVLYSAFIDPAVADEAEVIGVRRCVRKGDIGGLVQALRELTAC